MSQHDETKTDSKMPDWLVVAFLVEVAAMLIGMLMPIFPNKTGTRSTAVTWFIPEPSYWQEVAFWFVMSNILVATIGGLAWWSRRHDPNEP